jgi:ankyrin repeat protein
MEVAEPLRRADAMRKTGIWIFAALLALAMAGAVCFAGENDDLFAAIKAKDINRVRMLLASGANVNALAENFLGIGNISPLSYAVSEGDTEIVKLLLDKGADVNFKHPLGGGALITDAAMKGDTDIVSLLLAKGADINVMDPNLGHTPLTIAASLGHSKTVKLLLDHGVPVDQQTNWGVTSLQLVAATSYSDLLRLLLDRRADVNFKYKNNDWTALFYAAGKDCPPENTQLLIARGADVNAQDNQDKTAFYYAQTNANQGVLAVLVKAGANGGKMPEAPVAGMTGADIQFLTEQCKFVQSDIEVIPNLDAQTRQMLLTRVGMRDCKLLQPFTASRDYYRQIIQNVLKRSPQGWSLSYLTKDEYKQYMKITGEPPM